MRNTLLIKNKNMKQSISPYKVKIEIRESNTKVFIGDPKEYHAVIKARNGEIVFTGEPRKRKSALIKTVNRLFPNVIIIDKT